MLSKSIKNVLKCLIQINPWKVFAQGHLGQQPQIMIAAAEGTWAYHYHTVKHYQLFNSNDCTSPLFKAIFPDSEVATKFASAKTKITSIITGVLAPYAQTKMLSVLGTQPFSISVDASNRKEVKLFPLVIRFFSAKTRVNVRLLDLKLMPGETSEQIMNKIFWASKRMSWTYNSWHHFVLIMHRWTSEALTRGGKNNVFYHLRERKTCLIPVGCPAHILHNAAEKGAERLTTGIETIVLKIGSHFKSQTGRTNSLKQFCE